MVIILIYGFTQQSAVLVLNRFIKWNIELTNKLPDLQQLHQLQSGKSQQILITVLQIIICIVLVISEFLVGDDPQIYLLPLGFPGFIIECFIIQYSLIVIVLKKKYYDLNEILLSIGNSTNKSQNNIIFVTAEPCNQKLIDDFIFVRNSLRLLDDISRDLIGFFSLPALLAIILTSVQLIYHFYFFFILFLVPPPQNIWYSRYVNSFMWVIKDVYPTAILTFIITQTVTEVCMNLSREQVGLFTKSWHHSQHTWEFNMNVTVALPAAFILGSCTIQYALLLNTIKNRLYSLNESIVLLVNCISDNRQINVMDIEDFNSTLKTFRMIKIWQSILKFINNLYYLNTILFGSKESESISLCNGYLWTIECLFPLIILVKSVTEITREMERTRIIVNKVIPTNISCRRMRYELEDFSIQLLHRKVSFSACGLFLLDGTLLTSTKRTAEIVHKVMAAHSTPIGSTKYEVNKQ
ncbi:hypothetical protein PV326_012406 [Microctonus aethiopoides]|nr:hypothetical protein PV326_012406 [Microctonus aethiopoides]